MLIFKILIYMIWIIGTSYLIHEEAGIVTAVVIFTQTIMILSIAHQQGNDKHKGRGVSL